MKNWYEDIKWIGNYRFPLEHKGKGYREIFNEWISEYIDKVKSCSVLQKSDIDKIEAFSMGLLRCYDLYLDSKISEAYDKFDCLMNSVKDLLFYVNVGQKNYGFSTMDRYYRIRAGEKNYSYKEMLHIPLKSRCFASINRFSVPGMPCSYLASELTLCWYECGMPLTFQMAKYDIDLDNAKGKNLLRLDINPLEIIRSIRHQFYHNASECDVKKYITSVCYTLPLLAACSVIVENKGVNFIAEYVLPQMLMVWIKSKTDIAGIRYNSAAKNELARNWNEYNVAIPVRDDNADGYCEYLTSLFRNDMREMSKTIEINKYIFSNMEQIEMVREFYYKVNLTRQLHKTSDPKQDIADIDALGKISYFTQNLLILLEQLKNEDVDLTYAMVMTISNLYTWGELIENSIRSVSPEVDDMKQEFANIVITFVQELSSKFRNIRDGEN